MQENFQPLSSRKFYVKLTHFLGVLSVTMSYSRRNPPRKFKKSILILAVLKNKFFSHISARKTLGNEEKKTVCNYPTPDFKVPILGQIPASFKPSFRIGFIMVHGLIYIDKIAVSKGTK